MIEESRGISFALRGRSWRCDCTPHRHSTGLRHWACLSRLCITHTRKNTRKIQRNHSPPNDDKMADFNWRTLNIDALDPESSYNFDLKTLTPTVQEVSTQDVQQLSGQIRQLMRGGQSEEALKGALENPPYGADEQGKVGFTPVVLRPRPKRAYR